MSATPAGWEGILHPGEEILWQGRSAGRLTLRGLKPQRVLFGLAFAGFALFWMQGAARSGAGGPMGLLFPLFGLPFLVIGLQQAGTMRFWDAFVQRRSWYTLTSRRAIIAREIFGRRSLAAWPISAQTVIDLVAGPPDSIHFADRKRAGQRERFGFEQIDDGPEVLGLMRRVQRGFT